MRPCTVRQRQMYLRKHPAGFLSNKLPQKVSKKMPMSIASVVLHEKEQEAPKEIPISFPVRLKPDIQVVKVIAKKKNLRNVQTSTGGGVYKLSSSRQQDLSTQLWCRPHLESELKMRKKCDKMVKLEICSYKNNSVWVGSWTHFVNLFSSNQQNKDKEVDKTKSNHRPKQLEPKKPHRKLNHIKNRGLLNRHNWCQPPGLLSGFVPSAW